MSRYHATWTVTTLILGLTSLAVHADIVPVVSAKSRVSTLSKAELVDIFLGKRARFPDGDIAVPIDQAEGSAARDQFYSQYAAMSSAQLQSFWARIIFTGRGQPPRSVSNGNEAKKLVTADPDAITYIDRTLVDASVKIVSVR